MTSIAFIGFGEAARAFVDTLREVVALDVRAYDIRDDAAMREAAAARGVTLCPDARSAIAGAEVVFSAVTAGSAGEALVTAYADPVAPHVLCDINSVSAGVKQANAARVRGAGAAYVDMAVMAPVHPAGHRTALLLAGDTGAVLPFLQAHGFRFEDLEDEAGAATSVKMVRSLFVKGLEAITVQCLSAAVTAGCGERVMASLAASYPGLEMPKQGAYAFERVTTHGKRRAEEVREVARTMAELGFPEGAELAQGIAAVQDAVAAAKSPLSEDALACARAAAAALRAR